MGKGTDSEWGVCKCEGEFGDAEWLSGWWDSPRKVPHPGDSHSGHWVALWLQTELEEDSLWGAVKQVAGEGKVWGKPLPVVGFTALEFGGENEQSTGGLGVEEGGDERPGTAPTLSPQQPALSVIISSAVYCCQQHGQ